MQCYFVLLKLFVKLQVGMALRVTNGIPDVTHWYSKMSHGLYEIGMMSKSPKAKSCSYNFSEILV